MRKIENTIKKDETDMKNSKKRVLMKGKILIIVPSVRLSAPPTRFPLGLAYLAASFEQNDFDVSVLDLNILRLSPEKEEQYVHNSIQDADLVAMGGMITMLNTITRLSDYIHKYRPGLPVIVGGPISSCLQEKILRNSKVTVLVQGEGEKIGPSVAEALIHGNENLSELPGLSFLKNNQIVKTSPPERIDDINSLPFPAYHLFPFSKYLEYRGSKSTDIIGSRGCPFKCTFCFRNFGNKVVFRSVESIISEISFLKYFYNISHVHLEDELFVQRADFLTDFCNQMKSLEGVTWSACARVNTISLEILKEMKDSGCLSLMIGIESFCDDRLKEMRKGVTVEQVHKACVLMNKVGIQIWPGLIFGMPGETEESVRLNVEGCIKHNIKIDEWSYAFATPYPGTELYEQALKAGKIKDQWEYIQQLNDVGDTKKMTINLTKFSNSELIEMRQKALSEVEKKQNPPYLGVKPIYKYLLSTKKNIVQFLTIIKNKSKGLKGKISHVMAKTPFSCIDIEHFNTDLTSKKSEKLVKKTLRMIEIEVFSYCNRQCWFCPNSQVDRHSENIMMKESIYNKILQNLKSINYHGMISYSRYNEPLADPIIFKRLKQAKEVVPNACLHINTNGDYFNHEVLHELYDSGLRSMNIQVYIPEKKDYTDKLATEYMMHALNKYGLPYEFNGSRSMDRLEYRLIFRDMKIRIYIRNFYSNGVHRGATISELEKNDPRNSPCLIPFHDIYIDYNGKVNPCCNIRSDVKEHLEFTLGDLNNKEETIFTIFNSTKAVSWRKSLLAFSDKNFPCDKCAFSEISRSKKNLNKANRLSRRYPSI